VAERKPTRLTAGARIRHDDRSVEEDLFSFRLVDFVTCPILRRIRLVPLESFNALEELQQESHDSVYVYDIHKLKRELGIKEEASGRRHEVVVWGRKIKGGPARRLSGCCSPRRVTPRHAKVAGRLVKCTQNCTPSQCLLV
jgi:hypothetical protein